MKDGARLKRLVILLTKQEKERIEKLAKENHMPASTYARAELLKLCDEYEIKP